ncbi:hypothetical protein HPP92_011742 [Vanilla planifolia]|uniref:Uncharacterized protein n=1 Tax=Vanilla planifolia TaxID=51239 RepID=A0A835R4R6_VANPL|nr:hypothetical protein HPP92_011742 [Vanilla planifolia]
MGARGGAEEAEKAQVAGFRGKGNNGRRAAVEQPQGMENIGRRAGVRFYCELQKEIVKALPAPE